MTIAIVALLTLPALASAKDMTGKMGLGFNLSDAPIGIRYWFSPNVGLDAGIGVQSEDLGSTNATDFWVEAGLPYIVYGADQANLFFRVGAELGLIDERGSSNKQTHILVTIGPGAEVFFGDHFSLQAAHGIGIRIVKIDNVTPPAEDTFTDFVTFGASVTDLGFHFYF